MHKRKEIRRYVAEKLNHLPIAKARVFKNRFQSMGEGKWANVYTLNEQCEDYNAAPRELKRNLNLVIEGSFIGYEDDLEDFADDFSWQVEEFFKNDRLLGGIAKETELDTTTIEYDQDGELPYVRVRLHYGVEYITEESEDSDYNLLKQVNYKLSDKRGEVNLESE